MPRLLIVSPHFPPVNTPDMQRVRMSLPHFVDAGWEVVVLTVDDCEPLAPLEPELLATVPAPVRVVRCRIWSRRWTRFLGINNLGLRSWLQLCAAGGALLRERHFDLVYFSTTQFVLMPLGRLWWWAFGVPYVIDLQDPWLSDYYTQPGSPRPPGGWKYWLTHAAARWLEGWTLRKCAHIISVSPVYLETLARRYPWYRAEGGSTLTFGAPDADFAIAQARLARAPRLLPATSALKIVYAGRLGPDMEPALDVLFAAIARFKETPPPFTLHFYGTSYAPAGRGEPTTRGLAARHGIGPLVREQPARIGYLDSLQLLLEADLILLLGSDDRAYSPSKVYPALLAGKPVAAITPSGSVLEGIIQSIGGAALLRFNRPISIDEAAVPRVHEALWEFARNPGIPLGVPIDRDRLRAEYSAATVAARQLALFNRLITRQRPLPALGQYSNSQG
jgi:glycosyltransferase involved in cell wall biosynthesis